jgi:two-component system, chemotaxis family, protein-glutamate methylesterase/glutaminase
VPGRDIIVVGASAGGVEPLIELARALPAALSAAVFVVLHIPITARSALPNILSKAGPLPAAHPADGEIIRPGHIYVAPPNNHLTLSRGRTRLDQGPRLNGVRPSVDALFLSASESYGPRVTGVLLSGTLGDGSNGLRAITMRGGLAVIQDPQEARFPGMPSAALARTDVHSIVPAADIGPLVARLAAEPVEAPMTSSGSPSNPPELRSDKAPNEASGISCPACNGSLWEVPGDPVPGFECRVGHRFSGEAFLGEQAAAVESAVWSAINSLQERADTLRRIAARLDSGSRLADRYLERSADAEAQAATIREALNRMLQAESVGEW